MATEPSRDIEEQLKAYARQRQAEAGPPLELPPGTRQLLQTEVARTYAEREERVADAPAWYCRLWPRLAFGLSLTVLLLAMIWLQFRSPSRERELALAKPEMKTAPPPQAPVSPVPAAPSRTTMASKEVGLTADRDEQVQAAAPADRALAPAESRAGRDVLPAPTGEVRARGLETAAKALSPARGGARALEEAAPAVGPRSAAPISQQFVQIQRYRSNLNSPPLPGVLQSFVMEQEAAKVRIIDQDGSVYEGEWLAVSSPGGRAQAVQTGLPAARPGVRRFGAAPAAGQVNRYPSAAAWPGVPFRVTGTNRTSNESVVFEGTLSSDSAPLGPAAPAELGTNAESPGAQAGAVPARGVDGPYAVQRPQARIQGQLYLGDRTRLEITAAPVTP